MNPFSNMFLIAATLVVVSLQLLVVYAPPLQTLFHTVPLSLAEWFLIIAVASSIIVVEEVRKMLARRGETTDV